MASNSYYEATVFLDYFPWGGEDADLIDNFMRQILSGLKGRMNDEHFWLDVNEGGYSDNGVAEGRHREESARIWPVGTFSLTGSTGAAWLPEVPDFDDPWFKYGCDRAIFVVYKEADTQQLNGSVWWRDGTVLRAIRRMRGQVELSGRIRMSKINKKLQDLKARNFTLDEGHTTRHGDEAKPESDGLDLIPYVVETDPEKGAVEDEPAINAIIYPIRAANWSETGLFTAPTEEGQVHGVGIDVGNLDTDGVRFVITPNGIQVKATGKYNEDTHPILFNGIDLRNHDHSGNLYMGKNVDFAALGSLTWNHETSIDTTNIGAINLNDWKEIGTNLNHEEYHPPAESEEATIYDTTTRLYQFSFGMASNTSLVEPAATGGVYGEWRPAIFAVTQATVSPNASQSTGPPRGIPVLCTAWCPVVMTCSAWLTTDLWLFPGDARVPPTEKFRFWVQYGGYNLTDATAYVRVRTLAFKA